MFGSLHLVVPGPVDQRTGGYLYDARMVAELRERGHDVTVHELEGSFPRLDATAERALGACLSSCTPGDAIVVDGLAGGLAGAVVGPFTDRLRIVSLVHHPLGDEAGLDPRESSARIEEEMALLRRVRGVIVTSRFTAGRISALGVDPSRVRAVLPGTAPADPSVGPGEGEPAALLCVGTLIPRKGQLDLIQALALLPDLDWRCTLVGSAERDPAYAARVRGAIERTGLEERVIVAGEVDDATLDRLWLGASLFVLPSAYEGYGMALTEALVRGLPVVTTNGGAIPWTVPADAGVLIDAGDVPALARELRDLLTDPRRRADCASGARRAAASLHDWPVQARAFEAAVEELVA